MQSPNIPLEQYARLLRDNNVTRGEFIERFQLEQLVNIPELPPSTELTFVLLCALIFVLFGNTLVHTVTNIFKL